MAIMITLGLILGFQPEGGLVDVLLAVIIILIFSFCFSWIWTTLGIIMRSEKSLMMVSMIVLFPLIFIRNRRENSLFKRMKSITQEVRGRRIS
ncbi:hypothetical protein [Oceanobacillus sp. CFH 90083]|uniref:hypothetical protein n=1 Tax=Oceanobacillus sp. CFH 90083 TaxID=2592336 RepID=UPI003519FC5E